MSSESKTAGRRGCRSSKTGYGNCNQLSQGTLTAVPVKLVSGTAAKCSRALWLSFPELV